LWFAQTLGLRFNEPDFWAILRDWPPSLVTYWHARYLLAPWDMANRKALAESKYEAPKELTRKGRFMTKREILESHRKAVR
jgi:hypothetical protein